MKPGIIAFILLVIMCCSCRFSGFSIGSLTASAYGNGFTSGAFHPVCQMKSTGDTIPGGSVNFKTARSVRILSLEKKQRAGDDSDLYTNKCRSWSLTATDIMKLLKYFRPMSSEEQYLIYLVMPCEMTGEMEIDHVKCQFWINAGSTLTLKKGDTTFYFGCSDPHCKKYFLAGEDDFKENKR